MYMKQLHTYIFIAVLGASAFFSFPIESHASTPPEDYKEYGLCSVSDIYLSPAAWESICKTKLIPDTQLARYCKMAQTMSSGIAPTYDAQTLNQVCTSSNNRKEVCESEQINYDGQVISVCLFRPHWNVIIVEANHGERAEVTKSVTGVKAITCDDCKNTKIDFNKDQGKVTFGRYVSYDTGMDTSIIIYVTMDNGQQRTILLVFRVKEVPNTTQPENYETNPLNLQQLQGLGNKLKKTNADSIQTFLGGAIEKLMGFIGSLALAMFVYAGFLIMTAAGNSEKTEKGTHILIWSGLGVIIVLSAYILLRFIFEIIV